MRIAVAQLRARDLEDRKAALDDVRRAIHEAGRRSCDLVVLPECAWPAYVLGTAATDQWEVEEEHAALAEVAAATREAGLVSVVGLALTGDDGHLRNVAVVHEPTGEQVGAIAKRFLWDIDTRWFAAGERAAPVDTTVGRLGVFVCADGRMPEIARSLALQGAQLLVDPTAWVTAGDDPATWTNPQYEFMLSARAWENGLPAVAANKVGVEESAVAYCGRSVVLDAEGRRLGAARSDGPELLVVEVELPAQPRPRGHAGDARHAAISRPTAEQAAHARRTADLPLLGARPRLVAVPGMPPEADSRTARVIEDLRPALVVRCDHAPRSSFDAPAEVAGLGLVDLEVDDLDGPEPARLAMLAGADVLVWRGPRDRVPIEVLRTRAAENRVFLVALDPDLDRDGVPWGLVIDPDGRVGPRADADRRVLVADLRLADARTKEMAPGTDVVAGRQPDTYGLLAGLPPTTGVPR